MSSSTAGSPAPFVPNLLSNKIAIFFEQFVDVDVWFADVPVYGYVKIKYVDDNDNIMNLKLTAYSW